MSQMAPRALRVMRLNRVTSGHSSSHGVSVSTSGKSDIEDEIISSDIIKIGQQKTPYGPTKEQAEYTKEIP